MRHLRENFNTYITRNKNFPQFLCSWKKEFNQETKVKQTVDSKVYLQSEYTPSVEQPKVSETRAFYLTDWVLLLLLFPCASPCSARLLHLGVLLLAYVFVLTAYFSGFVTGCYWCRWVICGGPLSFSFCLCLSFYLLYYINMYGNPTYMSEPEIPHAREVQRQKGKMYRRHSQLGMR